MTINFEEDVELAIDLSDAKVKVIATLAQQQLEYEKTVEELNAKLKDVTKKLRKVQEEDLPNAMAEAGVLEFALSTGEKITVKPDIYPTIPKPKTLLAYNWLREHGHGSIIKNNVTVQFGKGEDDKATYLLNQLTDGGYRPVQKESVHPGTLKSFVKEQMADPETPDLPDDLFTVFEVKKAMIKLS